MHVLLEWKLKKNLSFSEIGKRTGFNRTKVHRQLTGETGISVDDALVYFEKATRRKVSLNAILGLDAKRSASNERQS